MTDAHSAIRVPPAKYRLRTEVFDALCTEQGWRTNEARAEKLGVARRTVIRLRQQETEPGLSLAKHIAMRLGTEVDALFGPIAGEPAASNKTAA